MTLRPRPNLKLFQSHVPSPSCGLQCRRHAATAAAVAQAPYMDLSIESHSIIQPCPPSKPPSHKPPELRKSQLLRQYTSLLRSTPVMLIFQHNNLRATEWSAIRRELEIALRNVAAANRDSSTKGADAAHGIRLQVIRPSMFEVAARIVEFFDPTVEAPTQSANMLPNTGAEVTARSITLSKNPSPTTYSHSLSAIAHAIASGEGSKRRLSSSLNALLSGPIALVTFPTVSPEHLAAVLRILYPTPGANSAFPAPRRREAPGYYELPVQQGLQKLLLLGARIEGQIMDQDRIRWVGGIAGGMDGLRAQVVHLLQGLGASITNTLEGASRSLYFTMESRRIDLDGKEKDSKKENAAGGL